MNKTTACHCGEDGYYSCVELREQLEVARNQLKEAIATERSAVVAWLRENIWQTDDRENFIYAHAADTIERGEHHREE